MFVIGVLQMCFVDCCPFVLIYVLILVGRMLGSCVSCTCISYVVEWVILSLLCDCLFLIWWNFVLLIVFICLLALVALVLLLFVVCFVVSLLLFDRLAGWFWVYLVVWILCFCFVVIRLVSYAIVDFIWH